MARIKKQRNKGPTHYELFGIGRKFTEEELQAVWRIKARENHPDKGGSAELFAELSRAYATLRDPAQRKAYDAQISLMAGPCIKCNGVGMVYRQKGFTGRAVSVCPECSGSGLTGR